MTEGVAATALMLLENTRLTHELRASRTRITEAAQAERVRLERPENRLQDVVARGGIRSRAAPSLS